MKQTKKQPKPAIIDTLSKERRIPTKFKGLQEAYKEAKFKADDPGGYYKWKQYNDRKARRVCTTCGFTKITEFQRKHKHTTCVSCRKEAKNKRNDKNGLHTK